MAQTQLLGQDLSKYGVRAIRSLLITLLGKEELGEKKKCNIYIKYSLDPNVPAIPLTTQVAGENFGKKRFA